MLYLKSINDHPEALNDKFYTYFAISDLKELFSGAPFIKEKNNFDKYNSAVREEISQLDLENVRIFDKYRNFTTGVSLRFSLEATNLFILKAALRRKYCFNNMTLYNSSGFDIYGVKNGVYYHKNVLAPVDGMSVFAHPFRVEEGESIVIYFPNYNEVTDFYIGIRRGYIRPAEPFSRNKPVLFYGNSITQGASASRSGTSFSNIFSRKANCEIVNFSLSNCCRGLLSVADIMGKIDAGAIIIDYSRNAQDGKELLERLDAFYLRIRSYHSDIPIVLMTVSSFGNVDLGYMDVEIKKVFEKYKNDKLLFLLDQRALFEKEEYDLVSVDGIHYNDMGMLRVADELINILYL